MREGLSMHVIRNARPDEHELLAEIGYRAWKKAMGQMGQSEDVRAPAREAFVVFTLQHWALITVIETGGRVAGWASRDKMDDTITDLWIDTGHQGQGLGSALLAYLEQLIIAAGYEQARAEMHATNEEAIRFFRHHGYAIEWMSTTWSSKLDRDVESLGLHKVFDAGSDGTYGHA